MEDNPVNVKVAELHLEKMGHAVTVAVDGPRALAILTREPFDVVLMDLELPGMDGLEVARRIRSGGAGRDRSDTPVVALTAHALSDTRQRCLDAGMNDYVAKPVNFFELEALIGRILGRGVPSPGQDAPDATRRPLFDKELAMRRLGIDEATLTPIFQAALDEFGERLDELRNAAQRGDMAAIQSCNHTLKSISGTIGFQAAQGLLDTISEAVRHTDPRAVRAAAEEMARLFGLGLAETRGA